MNLPRINILIMVTMFWTCDQASTEPEGINDDSGTTTPLEYGTIKGTVYDVSSNSPISGITVMCGGKTSTTLASGFYQLNDIQTGARTLTASKSDYETYSSSVNINTGTATIDIYMTAGVSSTSISGYVRDKDTGSAIQGAKITIAGNVDYTDASGHYQLPNIPQGEQGITAEMSGYDPFSGATFIYSADKQYDIQMTWTMPIIFSISHNLTSLGNPPAKNCGDPPVWSQSALSIFTNYDVSVNLSARDGKGIQKVELEYKGSYWYAIRDYNSANWGEIVPRMASTHTFTSALTSVGGTNYSLNFKFESPEVDCGLLEKQFFLNKSWRAKLSVYDTDGNVVSENFSWN